MARQTRTQAEITAVDNDLDVIYPTIAGASLNMEDRTVYHTTDPAIDLSAVNVRHLKAWTQFRGTWSATPTDGAQPIIYSEGDVVVGSDSHLYQLNSGGTNTDDPTTSHGTGGSWTQLSHVDTLGARAFSLTDSYDTHNLVYRGGMGANAGDLFVFTNSSSLTGTQAPLPTAGTQTNANWRQVGGGGLEVNGASNILDLEFETNNDFVVDTTTNTTEAAISLNSRINGLPGALPSNDGDYVLRRTSGAQTWESLTLGNLTIRGQIYDPDSGSDLTVEGVTRVFQETGSPSQSVPSGSPQVGDLYIDTVGNTIWVLAELDSFNMRTWHELHTSATFTLADLPDGATNTEQYIRWDGTRWEVSDFNIRNNLIFTDNANNRVSNLTSYRNNSGVERGVRSVNLIPQTDGSQLLSLSLAVFDPSFSFAQISPTMLAWDEPWESTDSFTVSVDNSAGVPEFINEIRTVSFGGTPTTFSIQTQMPTAASGVDWTQVVTAISPVHAEAGASGTTRDFEVSFNFSDGADTNPTTAQYVDGTLGNGTVTWAALDSATTYTVSEHQDLNFWNALTTYGPDNTEFMIGTSAVATESNISIAFDGGGIFNGIAPASTRTFAFNPRISSSTPLYKDMIPSGSGTITATVTRPSSVTGTAESQMITRDFPITYTAASFATPGLYFSTTVGTIRPTAYDSSGDAILTGDFTTGIGMELGTGVEMWQDGDILEIMVPTQTPQVGLFLWFGQEGSTGPIVSLETAANAGQFAPIDPFGRTQTVMFNTTSLAGSNVPAGWSEVTYTFTGVVLNAPGLNRIRVTEA